jgi:hypothetical protein
MNVRARGIDLAKNVFSVHGVDVTRPVDVARTVVEFRSGVAGSCRYFQCVYHTQRT